MHHLQYEFVSVDADLARPPLGIALHTPVSEVPQVLSVALHVLREQLQRSDPALVLSSPCSDDKRQESVATHKQAELEEETPNDGLLLQWGKENNTLRIKTTLRVHVHVVACDQAWLVLQNSRVFKTLPSQSSLGWSAPISSSSSVFVLSQSISPCWLPSTPQPHISCSNLQSGKLLWPGEVVGGEVGGAVAVVTSVGHASQSSTPGVQELTVDQN